MSVSEQDSALRGRLSQLPTTVQTIHEESTFSTLIKSLGVDAKVVQELLRHASFKTTMDGYTQAMEQPKRQAQEQLADLIMGTGKVGHA